MRTAVVGRLDLDRLVAPAAFGGAALLLLALLTEYAPADPTLILIQAVGAVACGWMAFTRQTGLALILLLLYLGLLDGFLKLSFGGNLVTIGRDALLYSFAVGAVARWILARRSLPAIPLAAPVLLFVVLCVAQLAHPDAMSLPRSVAALRPLIEFVPLFLVGFFMLRTSRSLEVVALALVAVTGINGAVALVQTQLSPEQLATWGPGYADLVLGGGNFEGASRVFSDEEGVTRVRPPALGSDFGFGGALGVVALPAALALLAAARRPRLQALGILAVGGVGLAIITSQARSTLITATIATVAYGLLMSGSRQRMAAILTTVLGAAVLAVTLSFVIGAAGSSILDRYKTITPDQLVATSITERKGSLDVLPSLIRDIPLGAGLANAGPATFLRDASTRRGYNAENAFNFLVIEVGVAGLLAFLALIISALVRGVPRIRRIPDPTQRRYICALVAGLIGYCASAFGSATFASLPGSAYLWLCLGAIARVVAQDERSPTTRTPQR